MISGRRREYAFQDWHCNFVFKRFPSPTVGAGKEVNHQRPRIGEELIHKDSIRSNQASFWNSKTRHQKTIRKKSAKLGSNSSQVEKDN